MSEGRACPTSMREYLEVVSPHLAPAIVGPEAMVRLRAVATVLPCCSLAGLELRLGDHQPDVDFFIRLPRANTGLSASLLAHPDWQAVQRLCDAVAAPSGRLHDQVRHVILEFDLDARPSSVPIPGVFLELNTDDAPAPDALWALAESLAIGSSRSAASPEIVDRCVAALPPGATVAHLGAMLSRPGGALRLVIHGLQPAAVPEYLAAIGWCDRSRLLSTLTADISAFADPWTMLDIDVADAVHPKVGVEFFLRRGNNDQLRWSALFAHLAQRGLASRTKTNALLAWSGFTQQHGVGQAWPENLALGDLLFRGLARSVFWRRINHVKLSYQPDLEPQIKAYLSFGHNWFPAGTATAPR